MNSAHPSRAPEGVSYLPITSAVYPAIARALTRAGAECLAQSRVTPGGPAAYFAGRTGSSVQQPPR
jgi:hypothetical protein